MIKKRNYVDTNNALVLTGGGARAAYQVGVLSAITKFVPRNHGTPFPILCGTSAGAINSTALACYASSFHLGVKKLEWVWSHFKPNHVYCSRAGEVFGHIAQGVLSSCQADYANKSPRSLFNASPLRDLLIKTIDFKRIDRNILQGYLSGVSVTTSSYSSGDSISFYQGNDKIEPWKRVKRRGESARLNLEHLMASSAIPLVFPSVKIKGQHFGDGSIHQLSPLSPAIHLGAKKIFIIGVEQPKEALHPNENTPHPPTTATVAGHLLDSIFSDTMHSDVERLKRVNENIDLIPAQDRSKSLRKVESFIINPSHDFNLIASQYFGKLPLSIRIVLKSLGIRNDSESSIASYLLFDKSFCNDLMKLGFEDAMNKETEIKKFLDL
jgi:NTE family protein